MDFFEQQDRARRNTVFLIFYFVLAVALIIVGVYLVVQVLFFGANLRADGREGTPLDYWDPKVFIQVAAGTLVIIALGTLYKILELAWGGSVVAGMFGGLPIPADTTDPKLRRLLNVVEEISLASGVPVPPVFLLEEKGINAFAAGFKPEDAVIAVSRGSIERLTRAELQGVIAHEFSHILNGDMRTNIRMMGVLHGIYLIALIGYFLLRGGFYAGGNRHRSRSNRNDNAGIQIAIMALGLAFMIVGYIGVFFGKLIKSAVSRQREFLADASAVQFTRYPAGIAGALKKIGGFPSGSRIKNPHAEEASHFFFANALRASFFNLLSTHPPLIARIRRLDPEFDGDFARFQRESVNLSSEEDQVMGLVSEAPSATGFKVQPEDFIRRIGTPTAEHLKYAQALRESIPEVLIQSIHDAYGARAVVYALLLDPDLEVRARQFEKLRKTADPLVFQETVRLQKATENLDPKFRLPLASLVVPALVNLSDKQYESFLKNIKILVEADHRVSLFEFALQNLLVRQLSHRFQGPTRRPLRFRNLQPLTSECEILLSALAHAGSRKEDNVVQAFEEAQNKLGVVGKSLRLKSRKELSLPRIKKALDRLEEVAPLAKKKLVEACAAAVIQDGEVTLNEAELLRVVCDCLGCPMPPILARE